VPSPSLYIPISKDLAGPPRDVAPLADRTAMTAIMKSEPTPSDREVLTGLVADSDEVARAFRDDVARCSDMMSPGMRRLAGGSFLAFGGRVGQSLDGRASLNLHSGSFSR
jgi:hypothetical protein